MTSIWVESLGSNLQAALDLMEAAIRDCTDELWQTNMWPVPGQACEVRDADGNLVTDPAEQHELVQRNGQPWGVAWHTLNILDANLTAHFVPWEPWPPFGGRTGDDITTLTRPWSRDKLLGYTDYCRQRVVDALKELTDERAATRIGRSGQLYAERVIGKMCHVVEHASQIRQFITAAGC